jgi:molecular chaperone GrpE
MWLRLERTGQQPSQQVSGQDSAMTVPEDRPEEALNQTPTQDGGDAQGNDRPEMAGAPAAEAEAQAGPDTSAIIGELQARIERLSAESEQLEDKYLRAVADLENFRRRSREEHSEAVRAAEASFVRAFLPIVDNFERALEAAGSAPDAQSVVQGVQLIHKQFSEILSKRGVKRIEAVGKPFDPHLHEAVGYRPTEDHPEGIVIEELERGYRMGKQVLRPSRVIVSVPPLPAPPEPEEESA